MPAYTKPQKLRDSKLVARWLEREVLRLKKLGIHSYVTIAEMITQAAAGDRNGVQLPDPEFVTLPEDYSVSNVGCWKALKRALNREPAHEAEEYRRIDTQRINGWLLNMAARLQAGDPEAIRTAIAALRHLAHLNGYGGSQDAGIITNIDKVNINVLISDEEVQRVISRLAARIEGKTDGGNAGESNEK